MEEKPSFSPQTERKEDLELKILLMSDEESRWRTNIAALKQSGHTVEVVKDEDALLHRLVGADPGTFNLIILDKNTYLGDKSMSQVIGQIVLKKPDLLVIEKFPEDPIEVKELLELLSKERKTL